MVEVLTGCGPVVCVDGKCPRVSSRAYVDPGARVMGDVVIGDDVVVMFGAVVRGDDDHVTVEDGSIILEHALVEAPRGRPVIVRRGALISHRAVVHGAVVGEGALIGIGAIVLDGAVIGDHSIVAAGAVVRPGTKVPPGVLVAGVPAKVVRELKPGEAEWIEREVEAVKARIPAYNEALGHCLAGHGGIVRERINRA